LKEQSGRRASGGDPLSRRIRIGISSCLLGERVRYNGEHKLDRFITDVLSEYFEYVPYCPEVAIGLGVPRPTIRLHAGPHGPRAVQPGAGDRDVTDALARYGRDVAARSAALSGYIFKSRSPSCGPARVKVYDRNGSPSGSAPGIYAAAFREALPLLPTEEEGRLHDPDLRDNFIERVFVYHRWQQMLVHGLTAQALIRFHAEHKFLLLAHSQTALRDLGKMVANLATGVPDIAECYITRLMAGLARPARRGDQVNTLQHVAGFFRKALDAGDRRELSGAIEDYRKGRQPVIVPLTLIRRHLRRHGNLYLESQRYLEGRRRR
jgi:uncharacterized protein YbgA (DUF1722 family)/uncharacterized protein YbbK (DUF523 family)